MLTRASKKVQEKKEKGDVKGKGDKEFEDAKRELLENESEEAGVYYDGGWDDTRNGQYTIDDYDGTSISVRTFQRLRKEGILGGNRLMTYKARKWHPVLKPGEKDKSQLGDLFFRQRPYKTKEQLKREDASDDIYGTMDEAKRTSGKEVVWQKVSLKEGTNWPKGQVLCTNNIEATPPNTDYPQTMTHVWIATLANRRGTMIGLNSENADGYPTFMPKDPTSFVSNVEYWAPVPMIWTSYSCLMLQQKNPYISKVLTTRSSLE